MIDEIAKDYDLSGQTALITGATSGIGADIARRLSGAGAKTILHYHSNNAVAVSLANELDDAEIVKSDLSSEKAIENMIGSMVAGNNLPDLLVNNAGVQTIASIAEADSQIWKSIQDVNMGGIYALTKHLTNALIAENRSGAIVNIASIEGLDPADSHAHYAASKAAVLMFTRASALEFGKNNIRINAVSPGLIGRNGIEEQWPEGVSRWKEKAPLERLGTGKDVSNAVHFLLSPASKWISGANIVVDGGMSAQNRW